MIDLSDFFEHIKRTPLSPFHDVIHQTVKKRLAARTYGELSDWLNVIKDLPEVEISDALLNTDCIKLVSKTPLTSEKVKSLKQNLMNLHPWRKGPFDLFGLHIDTEWHSDWKWQRLSNHISDLKGKNVLDIGCGSGYHCWRMRGAGAKLVVGIEPMLKFVLQFFVFKKYLRHEPVFVLPLLCEDLPDQMPVFDTIFSMGVLYHRRSPIDHLEELKQLLKPSGELVLETLIIEGDKHSLLVPEKRYAKMRNVWFIPSIDQLVTWLKKVGFREIKTVDINQTSVREQRKTDWMQFQSLSDFLDPDDQNRTIEGYPAPTRATIIAKR